MALIGLDPEATRNLATSMRLAADDTDALVGEVDAALLLAELQSDVPLHLSLESIELEKVGLVLQARADLVDGFIIDVPALAEQLDIPVGPVGAALDLLAGEEFDGAADPLLSLVADRHFLFDDPPSSLRQVLIGLPAEGEDASLDQAVDRVNSLLLHGLLGGTRLDHNDLSDQQRADIKLIAVALGGEILTEARTTTENHRIGPDEYEWRTTTEHIPIVDLGSDDILDFVKTRMEQDADRRQATTKLLDATDQIDRNNLDAEAERLGVTRGELGVALAAADLIDADNSGRGRGIAPPDTTRETEAAIGDDSFPDRADFPDGPEGDTDYISAVEQDRLDKVNAGINVVGPVGQEQTAFYEAIGSLYGAQNLAFSHDYQATVAEIQNQNDPGFLGTDIPNAITATVGYAAAVVTAPVIGAINAVFDTDIDIATVGTAIADIGWSAFGYDVDAPTIASSQAARDKREAQEAAMQDLQDRAEDEARQRDRDGNNDGRYDSRDDDYDNDGESDATDNTDDSGDPSGGHDGGV